MPENASRVGKSDRGLLLTPWKQIDSRDPTFLDPLCKSTRDPGRDPVTGRACYGSGLEPRSCPPTNLDLGNSQLGRVGSHYPLETVAPRLKISSGGDRGGSARGPRTWVLPSFPGSAPVRGPKSGQKVSSSSYFKSPTYAPSSRVKSGIPEVSRGVPDL